MLPSRKNMKITKKKTFFLSCLHNNKQYIYDTQQYTLNSSTIQLFKIFSCLIPAHSLFCIFTYFSVYSLFCTYTNWNGVTFTNKNIILLNDICYLKVN